LVPVFWETITKFPDEWQWSSGRIGLPCMSDGASPCSGAGAGGELPKGRGDRSRNWLASLLLGRSLLPCVCRYSHKPWAAATGSLARYGPQPSPLLLAVTGPMGVVADVNRTDWLSLALLCQSQSQSYITTDGQSVCVSWCQAPSGGS
jgi:hypothetical protein